MSIVTHHDPKYISRGELALGGLRSLAPSLRYASLLTEDGFSVANVEGQEFDSDRFASMASSTQALADAVARELRLGDNEFVIVAAEQGHVVQVRVEDHPLVLAALFTDKDTIGRSLTAARRTARRLNTLLMAK
ncbi:roadblock/LC7 domain-containing protein [Salinibacterium sp. UTAS2018]|uniref:roadblock/LC7 domain-containing protein n=1 Tax=unclassified Salinibacterium TaxID=2632331 RepID=UPI00100981F4|nr:MULTISPECIES: roadblock/LC7 domain-containing protein [unclassified Salinibacterium]MBH0009978.1 roadblock/LC7 domain-containing protein [Salinibacterium sp. SWN1162]QAV71457.1 roadblock/LC7 domain-containing protein [Salinibacterium sp. UTAS2018]